MDIDIIKHLIKEFENADIQRMKLQTSDILLELEKSNPTMNPVACVPSTKQETSVIDSPIEETGTVIKSPIVGIFYRSSSPNIDPFVQEGDTIKKGQVLCIVEAMKVMNEIKAPMDGVLVKIHVKNADLIEFDQPLMTIEG